MGEEWIIVLVAVVVMLLLILVVYSYDPGKNKTIRKGNLKYYMRQGGDPDTWNIEDSFDDGGDADGGDD